MEEVKLKDIKQDVMSEQVKQELKKNHSNPMNLYYRSEAVMLFSFISLLLAIFLWDSVTSAIYYFIFSIIFNLFFAVWHLYKHWKQQGVF